VCDSLEPILRLGPPAAPAAVATALAHSLEPHRSDAEPPAWLRVDQVTSFARVLASLARYRGVMLADRVGTGKTYVALAAALEINGPQPALCIVPAVLVSQWRRVAQRLGCPVQLFSHERLSRGQPPPESQGLVIIDESHHFRNPATRRYRVLCPYLLGRPGLLLSATPVVNRLSDLAAQLLLSIRDDALRWHGVPSLSALLRLNQSHPALGELMVVSHDSIGEGRPRAVARSVRPPSEFPAEIYTIMDALELSRERGITALVRSVLWHAAASSPAALIGALRRYRALLLQARDALASGREWNRAALRSFTGSAPDQLVLWPVVDPAPGAGSTPELALDDLPSITRLIDLLRPHLETPDAKVRCLRGMLDDQKRTLVFVTAQETVRYLRAHLDTPRVAWCTGSSSGIGSIRAPRASVLAHFGVGPRVDSPPWAPRCLLTTDVSAEGLDLQAAERVVHYDLPWTSVRLAQREGRALRLGSTHTHVTVVQFASPPEIERRLHGAYRLAFKARLPGRIGLGTAEREWAGWRERVVRAMGRGAGIRGVAVLMNPEPGILAGFEVGLGQDRLVVLEWRATDGTWWESPAVIGDRLAAAHRAPRSLPLRPDEKEQVLTAVHSWMRERLSRLTARYWADSARTAEARTLMRRLRAMGASAARSRDAGALNHLDCAFRFVVGGHTAGEEALIADMALMTDEEVRQRLPSLPAPQSIVTPTPPELIGVIVFRPPVQVIP